MASSSGSDDSVEYTMQRLAAPFQGYLSCIRFTSKTPVTDILKYVTDCKRMITALLNVSLKNDSAQKFWFCVSATYHKSCSPENAQDPELEHCTPHFSIIPQTVLHESDIDSSLDRSNVMIMSEVESFEENGSGWVIDQINYLDFYAAKYEPLKAGTYSDLPQFLKRKKAIVNVKNDDNRCFMWSILAALHPQDKNAERPSKYRRYIDTLNFDGITFPVRIRDIQRFTELNGISVNVFAFTGGQKIIPQRLAPERLDTHINLLSFNEHYCLIRHFDRLLGDQNRHRSRKHFCDMCLFPMYSSEALIAHRKVCRNPSQAGIEMPSEDESTLAFTNVHKTLRKPLVVYADMEAILLPIESCDPPTTAPYTEKYQRHEACSVGMVASRSCCGEPSFQDLFIRTEKDPAAAFLQRLSELADGRLTERNRFPLTLTAEQEHHFQLATKCNVCNEDLDNDKVKDHCHSCGKYRGALHSSCNLKLRLDREVVVVMHNLRRYDSHFVMQSLGPTCRAMGLKINCIAKGMEDYVTFSLSKEKANLANSWKIKFIDSAQFLPASLEQLVQQLTGDEFKAMKTFFKPEEVELMGRKGVFPYDFLSSWEKLDTPGPLPKECFFNKLTNSNVTDRDYEHHCTVWNTMNIESLRGYMELYLACDVLQLADVFEAFRKFSMDSYGLDPCHYSTLPGLAWDSVLKQTGVQLELLTDPDMYTFLESGIRGGISVISQRFAIANNPYMESFDPTSEQSFIVYLDENNLYGASMNEKLPTSGFRWLSEDEVSSFDLKTMNGLGDDGYILEVDLSYPPHLHAKHNDYPLAPEKIQITPDMLSPFCKEVAEKHKLKLKPVEKLAPNLRDKQHYVVDVRNLRYYCEQGLEVTRIHRVLTFKQSAWMSSYIEFNTQKRREATTEFGKTLPKLYVNAVFGKTMENVRKYINVELVTSAKRFRKLVKKPQFRRATIFDDNLVACCLTRASILLNKPIYIGFIVLELSKLIMYEFHYAYMKPMYGDSVSVLMTDTDSLMYHIVTGSDVYRDMLANIDRFDTCDYPDGHFLKSDHNKKVIGKMKDELFGEPGVSFVGLRSKMYSLKTEREEKKRAKGVAKRVVRKDLGHEDYTRVLQDQSFMYHQMRAIRSEKHMLYSVSINKKGLSSYDDKRYLLADGIHSLAYGHVDIP